MTLSCPNCRRAAELLTSVEHLDRRCTQGAAALEPLLAAAESGPERRELLRALITPNCFCDLVVVVECEACGRGTAIADIPGEVTRLLQVCPMQQIGKRLSAEMAASA